MKKYTLFALYFIAFFSVAENYANTEKGKAFITKFSQHSDYSVQELTDIFSAVERDEVILGKISKPAEKTTPWFKYRRIFMDEKRISNGVKFYKENKAVLEEAYAKYGVPAEIIVAIIGVETRYGKVMGKDKVITALSTIGFDYPKREKFFMKELGAFLKIAKKENINPLIPVGSYAGAMGMAQFMPSSYTNFAVDYEGDGKRDLWKNPHDAIFSIANYLKGNQWVKDGLIVDSATLTKKYLSQFNHKIFTKLKDLQSQGVELNNILAGGNAPVGLLRLDGEAEKKYFITFKNFGVITTYNTSPMYAMAVVELSRAIKSRL